jgi:molybdopterin converting factor small subunit
MREFLPGADSSEDGFELSVKNGATVGAVTRRLRIPDAMPKTVLVNRVYARHDKELQNGDVVSFLQPIAGG